MVDGSPDLFITPRSAILIQGHPYDHIPDDPIPSDDTQTMDRLTDNFSRNKNECFMY
jgi:hypothetical protein